MKRAEKVLLFLVLLFLPTQLGRHFWPQFSLVYSLSIDYLSPTIYFWDLMTVALLLSFIAQRQAINRWALNLYLLFLLTQLLSLMPMALNGNGLNLGAGLVRLEQYFIVGLLGVYLASINLSSVKSILFWSLTLAVLGESILAIWQFLKGGTIGLWILGERTFSLSTPAIAKFDFQGIDLLRPYATFPHPNMLAAFMIVTIPLLPIFKKRSFWIVWSVILGGVVTLLSVSRVALIAAGLEAAILLKRRVLAWLILGLILASPFLYTRFSEVFIFDNLSFLRREQLTQVAWQMFLSSPILGVGLNNFIPRAADNLLIGPSRFLQPVHNIFLLALSETGIIGLLGFLVLIGYPMWRLFKLHPLFLIWAVIIFLGLFDHYFLTLPQGYRLLFLVWGISISMLESKNAKPN